MKTFSFPLSVSTIDRAVTRSKEEAVLSTKCKETIEKAKPTKCDVASPNHSNTVYSLSAKGEQSSTTKNKEKDNRDTAPSTGKDNLLFPERCDDKGGDEDRDERISSPRSRSNNQDCSGN